MISRRGGWKKVYHTISCFSDVFKSRGKRLRTNRFTGAGKSPPGFGKGARRDRFDRAPPESRSLVRRFARERSGNVLRRPMKTPSGGFFVEKALKNRFSQLIFCRVRGIVRTLLFLFGNERRHHDRDFRQPCESDASPGCGRSPHRGGRRSCGLSSRAAEGAETACRLLREDVRAVESGLRSGRNESESTITTS